MPDNICLVPHLIKKAKFNVSKLAELLQLLLATECSTKTKGVSQYRVRQVRTSVHGSSDLGAHSPLAAADFMMPGPVSGLTSPKTFLSSQLYLEKSTTNVKFKQLYSCIL